MIPDRQRKFHAPSAAHKLLVLTKEWTAKVTAFVMNSLGVTALDSWNRSKLDLYNNNMAYKLQVLFQLICEHANRTLGGGGKIACTLYKNANHMSWQEI